jgi:hypothetical protein
MEIGMNYKCFVLLVLVTFLPMICIHAQEKDPEEVFDDLLNTYLAADYLDTGDCTVYQTGEMAHKQAYKTLLEKGLKNFAALMDKHELETNLSETQRAWLYSLIEDLCRRNPQVALILIDEYPRYYDLIAACRTEEALSYLADEADSLSPEQSGLDFLLYLFVDYDDTKDEELNEEESYDLRLLLIYLAIDGENINALKSLKETDEGLFFAAARLMEIHDKPFTEKPFLSESYLEKMEDILKNNEDSVVLKMAAGDKVSLKTAGKILLGLSLADIPEAKIERYSILFLWYLRLNLENGVLDSDVMKKYSDFMGLYNIDNLPIRRALCSAAGNSGLTPEKVCAFVKDNPKFKTLNPVEICMYPELSLCIPKSVSDKGEE